MSSLYFNRKPIYIAVQEHNHHIYQEHLPYLYVIHSGEKLYTQEYVRTSQLHPLERAWRHSLPFCLARHGKMVVKYLSGDKNCIRNFFRKTNLHYTTFA
jgi:hypothetical protein